MKTPTARKLPSGQWFCRVTVDKKTISITRSTEKEAIAEAMALKAGMKEQAASGFKSLSSAIDDYISIRYNILSPATVRGYRTIQNNRFQSIMDKNIYKLTEVQCKNAVNIESKKYCAKTIKNSWGFLSSVITETTGKKFNVHLPQEIPNERPFLDVDQIPVFLNAIKGTQVEIPALLSLMGLRRSEIMGLEWKNIDLEKGIIYVASAKVPDENNKMVFKKETKNKTSRREVPIIKQLHDALEACKVKEGFIYTKDDSWAYTQINRICAANDLPLVGMHGLRHSFASLAVHVKMPEDVAMEIGGWSDYRTMKKIYTKVSKRDKSDYATEIKSYFNDL